MKSTATVLIATALAVIAAATVFIALQVSTMADRLERIEGIEDRNCESGTVAALTQFANGREDIDHWNLMTEMADLAGDYCKGVTNDLEPSR
tara:strand:- start:320 stop:595 length:276 start_codon:yes stop_codon:yes gene_type:complete